MNKCQLLYVEQDSLIVIINQQKTTISYNYLENTQ